MSGPISKSEAYEAPASEPTLPGEHTNHNADKTSNSHASGIVPASEYLRNRAIAQGMRNRIAHGYLEINLDTVWETIQTALPDLIRQLPATRSPL